MRGKVKGQAKRKVRSNLTSSSSLSERNEGRPLLGRFGSKVAEMKDLPEFFHLK
jgi:hypothetical protein